MHQKQLHAVQTQRFLHHPCVKLLFLLLSSCGIAEANPQQPILLARGPLAPMPPPPAAAQAAGATINPGAFLPPPPPYMPMPSYSPYDTRQAPQRLSRDEARRRSEFYSRPIPVLGFGGTPPSFEQKFRMSSFLDEFGMQHNYTPHAVYVWSKWLYLLDHSKNFDQSMSIFQSMLSFEYHRQRLEKNPGMPEITEENSLRDQEKLLISPPEYLEKNANYFILSVHNSEWKNLLQRLNELQASWDGLPYRYPASWPSDERIRKFRAAFVKIHRTIYSFASSDHSMVQNNPFIENFRTSLRSPYIAGVLRVFMEHIATRLTAASLVPSAPQFASLHPPLSEAMADALMSEPVTRKPGMCTFKNIPRSQGGGGYAPHDEYARKVTGSDNEVRVTTPEGIVCQFDGKDKEGRYWEVKTGHKYLTDFRLAFMHGRMFNNIIDRLEDQRNRCVYVASRCGFPFAYAFPDEAVARSMRTLWNTPPVVYRSEQTGQP